MGLGLLGWAIAGVLVGFLAGMVPGLHPNILAGVVVGLWSSGGVDGASAMVLVVCMGVAHSFSNIVPSLLLGVPDESTSLVVLPAHRMVLSGRAREALVLYSLGGACGVLVLVGFWWLVWLLVPLLYEGLRGVMWLVLFGACYWLVSSSDRWVHALVLLLVSGLWGVAISSIGVASWNLLGPLLSGLFGLSTILYAWPPEPVKKKTVRGVVVDPQAVWSGSLAGLLAGLVAGMVPGIGCGECGSIATRLVSMRGGDRDARMVACMGSLGTIDVLASLVAIVLVGNPRSGIAVAASLVGGSSLSRVIECIGWCLFSSGVSCVLVILLGSLLLDALSGIDPRKMSIAGVGCIILVSFLLSGFTGLLVLAGSCLLGLACHHAGVRKSVLMGCLLVPAFLFFY